MSFQIIEIVDSQSEKVLVKVNHQDNLVTVIISNNELKNVVIGKSFQAEMGYDKILNWKIINDFDDPESAIWQDENGVHLLGRVHNIVDLGNDKALIDIYIQNGPEFFILKSEEIKNEISSIHTGLEITVDNLYIYPNRK